MKTLRSQLATNSTLFSTKLRESFSESFDALDSHAAFELSYIRLSSLEAWSGFLLENKLNKKSLDFFKEAQNDALFSHCLARIGAWRTALQCLRGTLENISFCLYYMDHSVEYRLWEKGKHSLPISDYLHYICRHPDITDHPARVSGLGLLKQEYSTLSKAVHSSSAKFRMTADGSFPSLMLADVPRLNKWAYREKRVLQLINQLLMCVFAEDLAGARLRNLRKSISCAVPESLHSEIKSSLGIRLYKN